MPSQGALHARLSPVLACSCWRLAYPPHHCASAGTLPPPRRLCQRGTVSAAAAPPASALAADSSSSGGGSGGTPAPPPHPKRYAVIGGGFAGVAVSWHLLASASPSNPVCLDLYDAFGLGAGGSGAAAGLLHPYTNRGKVLWRGLEAFQAAVQLVEAAEAASASAADTAVGEGGPAEGGAAAGAGEEGFIWRNGILRPARTHKQARDLARFVPQDPATAAAAAAELLSAESMQQLVPGMPVGSLIAEEEPPAAGPSPQQLRQQKRRQRQQQEGMHAGGPEGAAEGTGQPSETAGLIARKAVVLHPLRYLRAVWAACGALAAAAGGGSGARLITRQVASLGELEREAGPYDAVVVAAGAAAGSVQEMAGVLSVTLCQGYTLIMAPPDGSGPSSSSGEGAGADGAQQQQRHQQQQQQQQQAEHVGTSGECSTGEKAAGTTAASSYGSAPSLLGSTYISAHGPASLVVGATKRNGLSTEEALQECSRREVEEESERAEAVAALLPPAGELWPPVLGWRVAQVKSGVRALPARGAHSGSIPYAGRVPGAPATATQQQGAAEPAGLTPEPAARVRPADGNWWFVGGLGARGLVYHAWLGKVLAEAVLTEDEGALPEELLRWREPAGPSA